MRIIKLFCVTVAFLALTPALPATAHGAMQWPVSRSYACYLENPESPRSPACRAAVAAGGTQPLYDWNEVNIAAATGRHRELIPDGRLCGVKLTDTPAAYSPVARISGLRRVTVRQDPVDLYLDATANRHFDVRLDAQSVAGAKHTFTSAQVSTLQRNTRVRLTDDGGLTRLVYSADSPTSSLIFDTNAGERTSLASTIVPLPTSVETCAVKASNACGNTALPANKFSLRATTSSTATINLADCRVPGCADELRLTDLRVRHL